jgi:hypothetical protein
VNFFDYADAFADPLVDPCTCNEYGGGEHEPDCPCADKIGPFPAAPPPGSPEAVAQAARVLAVLTDPEVEDALTPEDREPNAFEELAEEIDRAQEWRDAERQRDALADALVEQLDIRARTWRTWEGLLTDDSDPGGSWRRAISALRASGRLP